MNEWMNEWMNESIIKWTNRCMYGRMDKQSKWTINLSQSHLEITFFLFNPTEGWIPNKLVDAQMKINGTYIHITTNLHVYLHVYFT